jgi:hypothetical protein
MRLDDDYVYGGCNLHGAAAQHTQAALFLKNKGLPRALILIGKAMHNPHQVVNYADLWETAVPALLFLSDAHVTHAQTHT